MTVAIRRYPRLIEYRRYAKNGYVPEAPFRRRVVNAQNHVMAFRRKTFLESNNIAPGVGLAGSGIRYRGYGHSGHGATHLGIIVGIMLDNSSLGADPAVRFKSSAATGEVILHAGNYTGTPTDSPSEIIWRDGQLAITANTAFDFSVATEDYARICSVLVYEIASDVVTAATNYYIEEAPGVDFPIWDASMERSHVGMSQLWRRNAGHLMTWPGSGTGTNPTYNSITWTNVIDGATTVSATTAPIAYLGDATVNLEPWRRYSKTTLDVVLAVHCSVTGSATGEVRLIDTVGTRASITGMGTGSAWYTTATTMSGLDTMGKVDLQCRTSNAANTVTLNAVSLYAYLA